VVVGFSGGADSSCLLDLLRRLDIDLIAAHLNHSQRPEAKEEERHCRRFAEALGVPFVSGRADVPRMSEELKIGIEEAGRQARYTFLAQALHGTGASLIATAHTKTDHVETVIQHLARGTGLAGLSGIPARRENVVRPLLPFRRAETSSYCRERGFTVLEDPGNHDINFSRARVRHRILPELEQINPNVYDAVTRLAQVAADEDRFLNGMAAAMLERCEIVLNGELSFLTRDLEVALDRGALGAHPEVLVNRGIRLAAEVLGGTLDYSQTNAIAAGLREGGKGSITCEGGEVGVEGGVDGGFIKNLSALQSPPVSMGHRDTGGDGEHRPGVADRGV